MGSSATLTLGEAVALLPVQDAEAREWLRGNGLVRDLLGREVVVWGDVVDAIKAGNDPTVCGSKESSKPKAVKAPALPRAWV